MTDARVLAEFVGALESRLLVGQREYGGRSFTDAVAHDEILREISEECLDLAGWSYILWCRVERIRAALEADT